jgi:transposase
MSTITAEELERRRQLGVQRWREGYSQVAVAEFLGVTPSAVCKWVKAARAGPEGLLAKPGRGRPPKLTPQRERQVLRWFWKPATNFGFPNELWTAPRVAEVIRRKWNVRFHPRYINAWLAERRITPQKPCRQPRERDDEAIRHWVRATWPRIKNERGRCARISS